MLVAKLFTILYQEFNTYWTEKGLNPYRWLSLHRWETDNNYCKNKVLNKPPYNFGPRLLDLLDTALFDFLIGRYLLADSIRLVLSVREMVGIWCRSCSSEILQQNKSQIFLSFYTQLCLSKCIYWILVDWFRVIYTHFAHSLASFVTRRCV